MSAILYISENELFISRVVYKKAYCTVCASGLFQGSDLPRAEMHKDVFLNPGIKESLKCFVW